MGSAAELCRGLERIAQLRSLKTLASAAELVEASAAHDAAAAELQRAKEELAEELSLGERQAAAGVLEIDRWRIGRAILNGLTDTAERCATATADLRALESQRRGQWLQERQLEERALERRHMAVQRHSVKRDEAATSEAATALLLRMMVRS